MKKRVIIVVIAIIIILIAGTAFIYGKSYWDYKNEICNIDINGYKTTGVPYSAINKYLKGLSVYDVGDLSLGSALEYDYSNVVNDLKSVSFKDYIDKNYSNINFNPEYYLNKNAVLSIVSEYNDSHTKSKDAYYELSDGKYVITNETYGSTIDDKEFMIWIEDTLANGSYLDGSESLEPLYKQPNITASDLQPLVDELNKYAEWYVSYKDGKRYSINAEEYIDVVNNEIVIDESFISNIVKDVDNDFTVIGEEKKFVNTAGDTILVSGGTWGKDVWDEKEKEVLTEAFYNHESLDNRIPVYAIDYDDIGKTYIEVSIKEQHCWIYENGECIMDTDIVTGTNNVHTTPRGIYYIVERVNGKYLKGDGYKTWVDKWMRLTWGGIGLHDASWRGSFGGEIYKTNGSHGCINLPVEFAYTLYDISYIGMPVIIY